MYRSRTLRINLIFVWLLTCRRVQPRLSNARVVLGLSVSSMGAIIKAHQGRRQRVSRKGTSGTPGTGDLSAAFRGAPTSTPARAARAPMPQVCPLASALLAAYEPSRLQTHTTHNAHRTMHNARRPKHNRHTGVKRASHAQFTDERALKFECVQCQCTHLETSERARYISQTANDFLLSGSACSCQKRLKVAIRVTTSNHMSGGCCATSISVHEPDASWWRPVAVTAPIVTISFELRFWSEQS